MTPTTAPTGAERHLHEEELIVTKTDLRGRITYANDVFLRFSALSEDEAVGQPHNLIRHPDMPGGVFAVLWERVQAGPGIFSNRRPPTRRRAATTAPSPGQLFICIVP